MSKPDAPPGQNKPSGGKPIKISSITVDQMSFSLAPAQTKQLTATVKDKSGKVIVVPLTWNSSNPAVATVSPTGLVTGVIEGLTSITVSAGTPTITSAPDIVTVVSPVVPTSGGPAQRPSNVANTIRPTVTIDGLQIAAANGTELQAAINLIASTGDPNKNHAVVCVPGQLTYSGNFIGRRLPVGTGKLYICTASTVNNTFPLTPSHFVLEDYIATGTYSFGQRLKYSQHIYEKVGSASPLLQLQTPNESPVFVFEGGAARYRFEGVEFWPTLNNGAFIITSLVNTQDEYIGLMPPSLCTDTTHTPNDIQFWHCAFHGLKNLQNVRRGLLEGNQIGVRDSMTFHVRLVGFESAGFAVYNSRGGNIHVNCFFDASSQAFLAGGAGPTIPNLGMGDFVSVGCDFTKDPTVLGNVKKNHVEHKNGVRHWILKCVESNNRSEGQTGLNNLQQTLNDENIDPPQQDISDIIYEDLWIRDGGAPFVFAGKAGYTTPNSPNTIVWPKTSTRRIHIKNVYCEYVCGVNPNSVGQFGSSGWLFQLGSGVQDLLVEHFTGECLSTSILLLGRQTIDGVDTPAAMNIEFRDCILGKGYSGSIADSEGQSGEGQAALDHDVDGIANIHNCIFFARVTPVDSVDHYPPGNFYINHTDVGFANYQNYSPGPLSSTSPYHAAATDGKDIGSDYNALALMKAQVMETDLPWL